jgi:hypothetical protein
MAPTIEQLQRQLAHGQLAISELLSLRCQLRVPFRLHPLGFLACTLLVEGARKFRLHYWPIASAVQQSPECQIHDHLFEFTSWVLAGSVENIEYGASSTGPEYAAYQTEYARDQSTLIKTTRTLRLVEISRRTFSAGSSYVVPAGVLHETVRIGPDPACTVLVTNDVSTSPPLVVGPVDGRERYVYQRAVVDEATLEAFLKPVATDR